MGDLEPSVDAGRGRGGTTATATLHWAWDLADRRRGVDVRRRGRAGARTTAPGRSPGPDARRAVAGRRRGPRRLDGARPTAATILGRRRRRARHRAAGRRGSASTSRQVPAARRRRRRPAARASSSTSTPAPYAKAVEGRRRQGVRRGHRLPRGRRPAAVAQGVRRDPGRAAVPGDICRSAPTRDFAAPMLGTRRPGHRRDGRGAPGAPTRPATSPGSPASRRGTTSELRGTAGVGRERRVATSGTAARAVPHRGHARRPALELTLDERLQTHGRAAARRRRTGQRAGGDPAQHRRDPGRGQRPGQRRPEPRDLRAGRAGLDVQDRQQPGPAARRAHPRDASCRAPRTVTVDGKQFKNYDDYPRGALGDIPLRTARRQLVQHRVHLPARRSSVAAPTSRRRGLARPRDRPRPRLPGLLRQRRAAGLGDRGRRRPDRPGHGARLADGDGDGDRLDPGREDGRAPAARSRSRCPRRSGPSRSPARRPDSSGGCCARW